LIDGKTFKREFKHQVTVGSPFTVAMERILHENRVTYRLQVSADDQRVDKAKTAIVAQIKDSTGGSAMRNFELDENGSWQLLIAPTALARYSVGLQVSGLRSDGAPVKEVLATQYFTFPDQDDPLPLVEEAIANQDSAVEEPVVDDPVDEAPTGEEPLPTPQVESTAGKKWLMFISIAIANLLVIGLAFFAFRMIMGKKAKAEIEELEKTLNTDIQKIVDVKTVPPAMQEFADTAADTGIDLAADDIAVTIDTSVPKTSSARENALQDELDDFDDFLADTDFSPASPDEEPGENDDDKKS
jgi:hypothetical protein